MRATKEGVFLLLVICVAVLCWSWTEHRKLLAAQASCEIQGAAAKRERAEIEHLHNEITLYQAQIHGQTRESDSASPKAEKPADIPTSVDLAPFMKKDPAYAELKRRTVLQDIRYRYGDLRELNLPPEQAKRLQELLIDEISSYADAREPALQAGLKEGSKEFMRAVNDAQNSADNAVKSFLGPSGYKELQSAAATVQARANLQNTFGADFAGAGMPLSNDQLAALIETQLKFQNSSQTRTEKALLNRATQVLAPEQLELFTQKLTLQQDSRALQERAMEAAKELHPEARSFNWTAP